MSHRSKGSWGKSHEIILKKPVQVKKPSVSSPPEKNGVHPLIVIMIAIIILGGFAVHLFI